MQISTIQTLMTGTSFRSHGSWANQLKLNSSSHSQKKGWGWNIRFEKTYFKVLIERGLAACPPTSPTPKLPIYASAATFIRYQYPRPVFSGQSFRDGRRLAENIPLYIAIQFPRALWSPGGELPEEECVLEADGNVLRPIEEYINI